MGMPAILTVAGADPTLVGTMVALYSAWVVVAAFVVPRIATHMAAPFAVVVICAFLLPIGYLDLRLAPLNGTLLRGWTLGAGVRTSPIYMDPDQPSNQNGADRPAVSGFVRGIGYGVARFTPIGLGLLRESNDVRSRNAGRRWCCTRNSHPLTPER